MKTTISFGDIADERRMSGRSTFHDERHGFKFGHGEGIQIAPLF